MTNTEMRSPQPIPAAPSEPINCYAAKAIRMLLEWDGLNPAILPADLSQRLAAGDDEAIPESVWSFYAQNYRDEQAQEILQLYRFQQQAWVMRPEASCDPNELYSYLPIELQGKSQLRIFIEIFDRYYLKLLGLEKGRSLVEGHVVYPYVERAFDEDLRKLTAICGLSCEARLVNFIMRLHEYYSYLPSTVAAALSDQDIAFHIADKVKALNPQLVTTTI